MKNQYNKTITACFVGYIVQAIVNNFVPLLFLFFQKNYHVPISQITLLVTFNFGIQLLVDLLSVRLSRIHGYGSCSGSGRIDPSYSFTGSDTDTIYRDIDFCNDLCSRWRTFGSSGKSGC